MPTVCTATRCSGLRYAMSGSSSAKGTSCGWLVRIATATGV